ncbi:MAG: DNA topoisomerase IV subunit A [Alphaproteobacteria bacterium]|nr:DNA topoisomerase IV subunit A [Alphaproteobacteria bacterium]
MKNIIKDNINSILKSRYLSYAVSTIISRSLPDVRDGLKPVHRRIIYSMYLLKLFNNTPFKKSARIVGDVMGKFHPHGDQAIYQSLVRMAQDFSSRVTLIEGQGNFGNIDGDNAAAMRYTEARLENITELFFDGIEEDSTTFSENYDGQNLEPDVLPSKLPNILLNGATGIAVGMATNIPPHNLLELNDCLVQLIKKPNSSDLDLLKFLKGPDLPTGGEIILSSNEKKSIYKKGTGSFLINSKWHKEKIKNGIYEVVITEIPFQVNKIKIIEQLANLINLKKIPLDDVRDESDENIRIVLKPKNRNIDIDKLVDLCFKLSDLSVKYSCNFNVLEKGRIPKQLGLKSILSQFIDFRKTTVKRKSKYNINKNNQRLEILKGYLIVFANLDKIIKIIRTKDDPKKEIIKVFKLSEIQAEAILNMRLGALKKLDELNLNKEIKKLKEINVDLKKLVNDDNYLSKFLIQEIKDINNGLIDKIKLRKSTINISDDYDLNINIDEFTEIENFNVLVTKDNQLKKVKDYSEDNQDKDSSIKNFIPISSNHKLLLFLSSGKVLTLDPNVLPGGKASPKSYIELINVGVDEKLIGVFNANTQKQILLVSKLGKGFISISENMVTNQKKGKKLFNLKNDDKVIKVLNLTKKYIACVTKLQKMLIFECYVLPRLQKGGGVQLIKIKKDDFLSDVTELNIEDGLEWSTGSKNRKLEKVDFWLGKRAQAGKKVPKFFNKNQKFTV